MESLLSIFLLFIAAITALLTYMIVPYVPVVTLVSAATIVLAAGVWWHWTQFSVDYRTSTWQEQLRNYASYAILLVVILLSYAFYVFAWSGSSLQDYAAQAQTAIRNAGRKATSQIIGGTTRALTATSSALFSEAAPEPVAVNRSANLLT
jgi:hypothetical protein